MNDDDGSLRPTHGGRVRLERLDDDGHGTRYRVTLATPDALVHGEARVDADGVTLDVVGADAWLVAWTRALLVTLAKRAEDEGWPRRVVRWREAR